MKHFLAFVAIFGSVAYAADVVDVQVRALDDYGGDLGSVLMRCQTRTNETYDAVTVTRDVTALKDSGEFEEVRADARKLGDGVEVTFSIRRKMRFIAPLVVHGSDYFSESKVAEEAGLKDGYLYGEGDLAAAAQAVRLAYAQKHYGEAKVTPSVRRLGPGDSFEFTFDIEEGQRRKVRDYVFEGAPHVVDPSVFRTTAPWFTFGEGEIEEAELHKAIDDYPWWNPIGWFSDSPVTDDQLAQAAEKVKAVFRNHGYLDVEIPLPERVPVPDSEKIDILFRVSEGPLYTVGDVTLKGVTRYPDTVVAEKSQLPAAGSVAAQNALDDAAHRIKVTVGSGDSGLADTRVDVKYVPRADATNVVDVVFEVTEGVPVVIDDVLIRGNDYTMDKVIRREIALGPGDRMLEDRAERSQKRLENLDYFTRVRYYLEPSDRGKDPTGAEYRNLVYEVEEKNTGSFMVGIGASSVDSVYITAEVSQSNFDIFGPRKWFRGAGQKGRASVAWGPRYQTIEASVTEPHLFNRLLELTVEGYRRGRWYDQYDLYRNGADVSLSYPVKFWPTWNPFGRLGARLGGEFIQFDDVDTGWYDYKGQMTQYFVDQERQYGDAWEGVLGVFWSRNSTDNFRMPSSGSKSKIFADFAAGDNSYWRVGLVHSHYFPVWKRFNHVFMARLRAETIDAFSGDLPIYDKMFLGGPRTIRGVKFRNVSPMIKSWYYSDYAPIGGQTVFAMNFEYTIPIVKMLRLAVFSDLGSVGEGCFDLDFADTFAWTGGLGVRLDIPMFPIRLDFAVPFVKPDEAEKEVFSFLVGYDF